MPVRRKSKKWMEQQSKWDPHTIDIRETYEVLWVEWEDGVAYRLASGRVAKEAWEEADLEDVSLVLG